MPVFVKAYRKGTRIVKGYSRAKRALRGVLASGKISGSAAVHTSQAIDILRHKQARGLIREIKHERMSYGNVFSPGSGKSHLIKRVKTLNNRQRTLAKYLK